MMFQLSVIDAKRSIFEGEATSLTIPAVAGEMTVRAQHMPVVTPITLGEIVIKTPEKEITLTVGKGMFSMENNIASLLVEDARYTDEISETQAQNAKERAEEIIKKGVVGPDMEKAINQVRRSILDLKVSRRRRPRH